MRNKGTCGSDDRKRGVAVPEFWHFSLVCKFLHLDNPTSPDQTSSVELGMLFREATKKIEEDRGGSE
jgi:hypothetical protein